MTDGRLSRRALLAAGAGSLGVLGFGGTAWAQSQQVSFDQTRQIDAQTGPEQPDVDLLVDWKEWYNGETRETQETPTSRSDTSNALITLPDVKPGDSGKAAIGLSVAAAQGNPPPMELEMRIRELPTSRQENGRNEPERKAGDTTDDVGELQEYLDVFVWYDTGIQIEDAPIYGACDAAFNSGDTELADGSLADVSVTSADGPWRTLDANPSNPADPSRCLRPNEALCLSFEWAVSGDENVNVVQSDSVSFNIEFRARQCPR